MGLEFTDHMNSWHEFAWKKTMLPISVLALHSFKIYNTSLWRTIFPDHLFYTHGDLGLCFYLHKSCL